MTPALRAAVEAWIAADPSPSDRAELAGLLDAALGGDRSADAELADRFADRLHFGTAGLRAPVGAGPMRMNVAVARAAAAGVAAWLGPDARAAGVVVGCDARHRSADMRAEVAGVLAGAGIVVHLLEPAQPTPLVPFAVTHLGAAAGLMVTASHNPAADNGIKLYLGDGAQVVAPVDAEIEASIASVGDLRAVPVVGLDHPLVRPSDVVDAYLSSVVAVAGPAPAGAHARVVHTAMHGVGSALFAAALQRAGHDRPVEVAEQAAADPDFPTVAFPNPEEPGALDLALAEARRTGADVLVANDPDADRVAVAVPAPDAAAGWRVLSGDEVGAVVGAAVLDGELPAGRPEPGAVTVVASSLVSSSLLGSIAAARGATHVETLTGFKWIARAADGVPGGRFAFGYEEALGLAVGSAVRDKDGICAGLAVVDLVAADLLAGRRPLLDRLDDLERRFGVHATRQVTRRLASGDAAAASVAAVRTSPPPAVGGMTVASVTDLLADGDPARHLPPADLIVLRLEGGGARRARVVLRPSGTEPKVKAYLEVVLDPVDDVEGARARAGRLLDSIAAGVAELLDGG